MIATHNSTTDHLLAERDRLRERCRQRVEGQRRDQRKLAEIESELARLGAAGDVAEFEHARRQALSDEHARSVPF